VNLVLTVTRNCQDLTKRMSKSVKGQDIPTEIIYVDNGSTDGSRDWLENASSTHLLFGVNTGVSHAWNMGIDLAFSFRHNGRYCDHLLVANNDVELAPWTYSLLLDYDIPFITGVATDSLAEIAQPRPAKGPLEDHPDFSLFLIRRDAWMKIGRFDERMMLYAQDCDYHIRGWRLGVEMKKACVPYFHVSSGTIKNAPEEERMWIAEQAHRDRVTFENLYGCLPGTEEYYSMFNESCFGAAK